MAPAVVANSTHGRAAGPLRRHRIIQSYEDGHGRATEEVGMVGCRRGKSKTQPHRPPIIPRPEAARGLQSWGGISDRYFLGGIAASMLIAASAIASYYAIYLPDRQRKNDIAQHSEQCRREITPMGEAFAERITDSGEYTAVRDYQIHYNEIESNCFLLKIVCGASATSAIRKERIYVLQNVTENKRFGTYSADGEGASSVKQCDVLGRHCSTLEEWKLLAKPYTGEITP